jgi:hypothetical protein
MSMFVEAARGGSGRLVIIDVYNLLFLVAKYILCMGLS